MSDPNKLSVELAPDVAEALRFLADQRGVTITEVTPEPKPSMPVSTPETRNELQWQVDELRREVEELRKVVEELPSQMAEAVSDRLHGRLA